MAPPDRRDVGTYEGGVDRVDVPVVADRRLVSHVDVVGGAHLEAVGGVTLRPVAAVSARVRTLGPRRRVAADGTRESEHGNHVELLRTERTSQNTGTTSSCCGRNARVRTREPRRVAADGTRESEHRNHVELLRTERASQNTGTTSSSCCGQNT